MTRLVTQSPPDGEKNSSWPLYLSAQIVWGMMVKTVEPRPALQRMKGEDGAARGGDQGARLTRGLAVHRPRSPRASR